MTSMVTDAMSLEMEGNKPWPNDVQLYQPLPDVNMLLQDQSHCLAVQTYLNMCGLNFNIDSPHNAEFMSPSGKVPFIKVGQLLMSEFQPIVNLVEMKGRGLGSNLTDSDRADLKAYIDMVEGKIDNAELYLTWEVENVLDQFTEPRYGSPYVWPLNNFVVWKKQKAMKSIIRSKGLHQKSLQKIEEDVHICCQALSEKLGEQEYFFGKQPTELDALVYGHLKCLTDTEIPIRTIANSIQSFPNLAAYLQRIEKNFMSPGGQGDKKE